MAMLIEVEYPGGERAIGTGYWGHSLVVQIIPRGPCAALGDEIEVDYSGASADLATPNPPRVIRVTGGPRRPTIRLGLPGLDEGERERWMEAREAEGWEVRQADDLSAPVPAVTRDPGEVWAVATRDGMDPDQLAQAGGVLRTSR